MMSGNWESLNARVYYFLGLAWYFYHWALLLGGVTAATAIVGYVTHVSIVSDPRLRIGAACLSAPLLLIAAFLWAARARRWVNFVNPQVSISKLVDTYRVEPPHYSFEKHLTIKALHNGVRLLSHEAPLERNWTNENDRCPRV